MSAIIRSFRGISIRQRPDGFIAMNDLADAGAAVARAEGRPVVRLDNWLQRPAVKAFISELSRTLDPSVREVVQTERGGTEGGGVTWGHAQLAHLLAVDVSPAFAVVVMGWVEDLRTTGVAVRPGTALDFAAIIRDPKRLPTLTLQLAQLVEEQAALLEQQAPAVQAHARLMRAVGEIGLQDLGRHLGRKPNIFIRTLIEAGYIFRAGKTLLPTADYRERGFFRVISTTSRVGDGPEILREQTVVLPAGLDYFAAKYPATDRPGTFLRTRDRGEA